MRLVDQIQQNVQKFATDQHGTQIDAVEIQPTKKDHEGDLTVVVFSSSSLHKVQTRRFGRCAGYISTKSHQGNQVVSCDSRFFEFDH